MSRLSVLYALPALGLLSCHSPPPDEPDDGITLLDPRHQLIRLSVDLRGVHPSEEELQAIEANPDLYDDFVDRYLHDPRFLDRMEEIFNYRYLTRTGDLYSLEENADLADVGLGDVDELVIADAIAEEPLQLVRRIVDEDQPWTEIVQADYTMSNPLTAAMWRTDYQDPGDHSWQPAHYVDGRPHKGILTMTTTWTRYPSAGTNANRHRANAVSRLLLCDDYLSRPVAFARSEIDSLTSGDPEDVIRDNRACQSCHSSLDPLASHFFGFWWEVDGDLVDQTTYHPEDEDMWREYSGKPPGYFGHPDHGVEEMADEIAADPRFASCAVQTVFEGLTQRTESPEDWNEVDAYEKAFDGSGLVVRELVRSIVTSRTYLAAAVDSPVYDDRVPTVRTTTPSQLGSVIEGITGYHWTFDGRDGLDHNDMGLVVLSGGVDGRYVTSPSHDPSVGSVFVQERLAQAAGWHVATHDLDPDRKDDAILLAYVNRDDTPESNPDAFDTQIRQLYLHVTGEALPDDAPEVAELEALWKQLYSVNASPVEAWAGVTSAVLRDPAVLFY